MGKKSGRKRKRTSSNPTNPVKEKKFSTEPQRQQPIASAVQYQDLPRNQSQYELPDPWLPVHWKQHPTYPDPWLPVHRDQQPTYPDPWLPVHWDQQTNYINPFGPYPKTYQDGYMVNPWSHFYLCNFPYQFPATVPSYYRRNDNLGSHSQSKGPTHKHCTNASGNLAEVSVNTDGTLSSSNNTASTVDLDATLPSSNDTASTVDLDATLPSSNDTASTVDLDATLPSNNKATTLNGSSRRVSKVPLRTVKMDSIGGLQVQVRNNTEEEEDVHYLYSVEPTQGRLVELVDLSEDLHVSSNQDSLDPESKNPCITSNTNSETSDYTLLKDYTGDDTRITLINNRKGGYSQNTHIGNYGDACCDICHKSLIQLQNNKCYLYSARCGHLFCVLCIKRLKIQMKCMKCNETISSLRKIVL